jgi:hypothetical protein
MGGGSVRTFASSRGAFAPKNTFCTFPSANIFGEHSLSSPYIFLEQFLVIFQTDMTKTCLKCLDVVLITDCLLYLQPFIQSEPFLHFWLN